MVEVLTALCAATLLERGTPHTRFVDGFRYTLQAIRLRIDVDELPFDPC